MYLGMDGGGTKTAFVLIDRHGTIRATHRGGCAFYLEVGMEAVRALIHDGLHAVLRTAGIGAAELDYAFFGLPLYGEDERTAELDRLPEGALPSGRYACGNDMVCGWAGSLAGQDGINVVAGTGSICYGEYAGRTARCGGVGELFSDEGSAYWIARSGLNLFSRMSDGRSARGPLYDLLRRGSARGAILRSRPGPGRSSIRDAATSRRWQNWCTRRPNAEMCRRMESSRRPRGSWPSWCAARARGLPFRAPSARGSPIPVACLESAPA